MTQMKTEQKYCLYPAIEPYDTGYLRVSTLHELYYEQVGNPHGKPVVFLHGGPGSEIRPSYRQFFDPAHYRIVLFEQRGCGRSRPHATLEENTTWHLVEDLEKIKTHLGIDKWIVFGGSWGSSLALVYAENHPNSVAGLVLRGIFTGNQYELDWMYKEGGVGHVFAEAWDRFVSIIPIEKRNNLMEAYHELLIGTDKALQLQAAKEWANWEASVIKMIPDQDLINTMTDDYLAVAFARIENHYFRNKLFFPEENYLLKNAHRIRHIPGIIVHGRYDMVCPFRAAWELHQAWPESKLWVARTSGHSATEVEVTNLLVDAMNEFRALSW